MPIVPSPREPIQALLARLDDPRETAREAAVARLRVLGDVALDALLTWLPGATSGGRRAAVAVLETLDGPRAWRALLSLCADGEPDVAVRALETAADTADGEQREALAAAAGTRLTASHGTADAVRRAAAAALVRLHRTGAVEALGPLLDVLLDESEDEALRVDAGAVLDDLPARERGPLLAQLLHSAHSALRERAVKLGARASGPPRAAVVLRALERLRGARAAAAPPTPSTTRLPGVTRRPGGADATSHAAAAPAPTPARPTSHDGAHIPVAADAAGDLADALRALHTHGVDAVASVAEALRREPVRLAEEADDVARALAALGPPALPALQRALDHLSPGRRVSDGARADAKAVLHLALARLDSRLALHDLRDMLAARPPHALERLLPVAAAVGDASVAAELARLAAAIPERLADCRQVFGAIVARERLTKRARAFKELPDDARAALDALWPRRK